MSETDFLGCEPLFSRPIAFHRCFMSVTTNCPLGALYLSQAWFWRDKGKDPDGWIYKTHEDFTLETGLTKKQQIRVRRYLESKPWWEEKVKRVGTVPTFHYRIDRIGLLKELSESAQRELSESAQRELSESAQRELSIYKDSKNTNRDYETENTHNPERARAAAPALKTDEPKPDNMPASPASTQTADSLVVAPVSGEGESSGGDYINLQNRTSRFEDSWNHSSDIAPITDEIIRLYNIGKPDNWTGIKSDSRRGRKAIYDMALKYLGGGGKLEELPGMLRNALLFYRSSDFHTKKDFGCGDIYWLCKDDRIEIAASKFEGMSDFSKNTVAKAIIQEQNGIIDWRDGKLMSRYMVSTSKRMIPKMPLNHPDLPPYSWVEKYMPELLEKLDPNYPKDREKSCL